MTSSIGAASSIKPLLVLNHYNPLEPAYARGSMAFHLGLGYEALPWDDSPLVGYQLNLGPEKDSGSVHIVNAFINLGTRWPIDFGILASKVGESSGKRLGGHVQWTFFQGFRLPSLAWRLYASQLRGLESLELHGLGTSLIMDYTILRYFNFVASVSAQKDTAYYEISTNPSFQLGAENTTQTFISITKAIGLSISLIPGRFELSVYEEHYQERPKRYLGKISLGI